MYRKILVPLDQSERSEAIFPHVVDLAKIHGSEIILLGVVEPSVELVGAAPHPLPIIVDPQDTNRLVASVEHYLQNKTSELKLKGVKVSNVVKTGRVVETIVSEANESGVDLIAMASHGRTGLAGAIVGSVTMGVLHHTSKPMLVIRS